MSKIEKVRLNTQEDVWNVLGLKRRDMNEQFIEMRGFGWAEIRDEETQELKQLEAFTNLVTDTGDAYYAKRASGISSPPGQVTGMKLGTTATAATKNGAASFIIAYVTGSDIAIDATFPQGSQTPGNGYQVQWQTTWAAGVATQTGIQEVSVVNQSALANNQGLEADSIARAVISPQVDKAAGDQLVVIWNHLVKGQ